MLIKLLIAFVIALVILFRVRVSVDGVVDEVLTIAFAVLSMKRWW